jgi:hypothetical protein
VQVTSHGGRSRSGPASEVDAGVMV